MMPARVLGIIITVLVLTMAPVIAMAAADSSAAIEDSAQTTTPEEQTAPQDVSGPAFATPSADAPHEAAADHGEGGLPQLNIATYPSQIFWLFVTFAVLYIVFSKKILPTIGAVVATRENLVQGNLDEAERLRRQAEDIRSEYEASLARARSEAVKAVQEVEAAAKARSADNLDAFRRKADKDMKAAEENVLAAKARAMNDVSSIAAEASVLAAEKITGMSSDLQRAQTIVQSLSGQISRNVKAA